MGGTWLPPDRLPPSLLCQRSQGLQGAGGGSPGPSRQRLTLVLPACPQGLLSSLLVSRGAPHSPCFSSGSHSSLSTYLGPARFPPSLPGPCQSPGPAAPHPDSFRALRHVAWPPLHHCGFTCVYLAFQLELWWVFKGHLDLELELGGLPGRCVCFLFSRFWAVAQSSAIILSGSKLERPCSLGCCWEL